MIGINRRIAGAAIVGVVVSTAAVLSGGSASASVTGVTPGSLANTTTAGSVAVASSSPSALFLSPDVQITGPGSLTDTYDGGGTATSVGGTCTPQLPPLPPICIGGTSSISASFNLDPTGLPAGPGTYALNACYATCTVSLLGETSTLTVTGDPPAPTGTASPVKLAPGGSAAVKIDGTGFAKHDTVTASDAGITFTVANPQGTATELDGTVAVGAGVADGTYDLTVKDTANQTGVCTGCVVVGKGGTGPGGTAKKTTLTLAASKKKVVGGKPVTLSGVLTEGGANGEPLAHENINVYGKSGTATTYSLQKKVSTTSAGHYSLNTKPSANTTYASYFGGTPASGSSAGDLFAFSNGTRHVVVAPVVVAKAKSKKSARTRPLVVRGHVKPNAAGSSVVLARLVGKHRHKLATSKLSSNSHFRFATKKLKQAGRYRLVVVVRHSASHASGVSKPIRVKRV